MIIISILGVNKVKKKKIKKERKKRLLSKGFVYEVHVVDFYNAFIFMKQSLPFGPAVFLNATNEES